MEKAGFGRRMSVVIVAVVLLSSGAMAGGSRPPAVQGGGQQMPDFSLKSVADGSRVSSSDLKGRVVLFVFFATWCPPCIQEIPTLVDIQEKYSARGFSVIGMSVDDGGSQVVKDLMVKMGINYPVLMADGRTTRGFGGVSGIPVAVLVDRQGRRVNRMQGKVPHRVLEQEIKKYL